MSLTMKNASGGPHHCFCQRQDLSPLSDLSVHITIISERVDDMRGSSNDQSTTVRKKIGKRLILMMMTSGVMVIAAIAFVRLGRIDPIIPFDSTVIAADRIGISENMDTGFDTYLLNASLFLQPTGTIYDAIGLDPIMESQGIYDGPNKTYTSYSFFIKNFCAEIVDIDYVMTLEEVSYGMDNHIRILVIEDDVIDRIYQKEDSSDESEDIPRDDRLPEVTFFESETTAFEGKIIELEPHEVKSFRVIIWADQQDPDIIDQDSRGHIKAQISFKISGTQYPHTSTLTDRKLWFTLIEYCIVDLEIRYEEDDDL